MHSYTLPDLQNRYGMRKSALHKFLVRHLGEINRSGQHALKTQNRWLFDDFAVSVLDRLRNFNQVIPADVATIETLNDTISNLQQQLLTAQQNNLQQLKEISALKDQLISELKAKSEIKKQLAAAGFKILQIEQSAAESAKLIQDNINLKNELNSLKECCVQLTKKNEELTAERDDLKNKSPIPNVITPIRFVNRRSLPRRLKLVNVKKS